MDMISVIVPVYKVEPYLDRCVQSIVDQTYKHLEIILVDDGSPDNCGAMCDNWAARDSRIKVIHNKNGGAGAARNAALDIAEGEFIGMVDSDDYISPCMFEHLINFMTPDVDIAECDYLEVVSDDAQLCLTQMNQARMYCVEDAMQHHISDKLFRQLVWNKLYRRNTIGDIRFPAGVRIDDEFWTYQVLANARNLVHSSVPMYAYRQQPGSVMHLSFSLARLQAVDAKCQRLEFIQRRFPVLESQARVNLWYTCLYLGQMSLRYLSGEERKIAFEKLYAALRRHPLTDADKAGLPLKQRIWSMLPLDAACKIRNRLKIGV